MQSHDLYSISSLDDHDRLRVWSSYIWATEKTTRSAT